MALIPTPPAAPVQIYCDVTADGGVTYVGYGVLPQDVLSHFCNGEFAQYQNFFRDFVKCEEGE